MTTVYKNIRTAVSGFCMLLLSCGGGSTDTSSAPKLSSPAASPLVGTWQLMSATLIEKGDTTVTDHTKGESFIKIINDTHFAFLRHDLEGGKDSALFVSGGGRYTLEGDTYTERLEYCSARNWEGNDFTFKVKLSGDTLVQSGVEKVESAGVDRVNTERYIRVKQ